MALHDHTRGIDTLRSDLDNLTSNYRGSRRTTFRLTYLSPPALECIFQTQQTACKSRTFCLVQTGRFADLESHLAALDITTTSTKVYNARVTSTGAVFVALVAGKPVKYYLCEPRSMIELLKFYKEFGHLRDTWHRQGAAEEDPKYRENFDIVAALLENYFAQNAPADPQNDAGPCTVRDCIDYVRATTGITPTNLAPGVYSVAIPIEDVADYAAQHFSRLLIENLKHTNGACVRDSGGARLLLVGTSQRPEQLLVGTSPKHADTSTTHAPTTSTADIQPPFVSADHTCADANPQDIDPPAQLVATAHP